MGIPFKETIGDGSTRGSNSHSQRQDEHGTWSFGGLYVDTGEGGVFLRLTVAGRWKRQAETGLWDRSGLIQPLL